jgi:hypothetical protein
MLWRILPMLAVLLVLLAGCDQDLPLTPSDVDRNENSEVPPLDPVVNPVDEDPFPFEEANELLAQIDLEQGRVDFSLVDREMIVVTTKSQQSSDQSAPLAALGEEVATLRADEIYARIAGEPPPQRLVEAVDYLEAKKPWGEPSDDALQLPPLVERKRAAGGGFDRDDPIASACMSASAFTGRYCTSGWDFHECLTDRTVGDTFNYRCWYMYFVVNTVSGSVKQQLRYEKSGSYRTFATLSISAGEVGEIWILHSWGAWIVNRNTRAIVGNVAGSDKYHTALWGLF